MSQKILTEKHENKKAIRRPPTRAEVGPESFKNLQRERRPVGPCTTELDASSLLLRVCCCVPFVVVRVPFVVVLVCCCPLYAICDLRLIWSPGAGLDHEPRGCLAP
jgi:hypothetical protein